MKSHERDRKPAWSDLAEWDMSSFLDRYTLHESELVSVMIEPTGSVVVTCQLDLVWNKSVREGFDTLLLALERTYSVSYRCGPWLQSTLEGATSKQFTESERVVLLESKEFDIRACQGRSSDIEHPTYDQTLTRTTFQSINWAELSLLHGAAIRCRCFNEAGESVDLAGS